MEVATPSKVCFPLIYNFFQVMLMSGIDEIRGCLEDLFIANFEHISHLFLLCNTLNTKKQKNQLTNILIT